MRVLIIGDIHGRHRELDRTLREVQTDFGIGAAIQLGDFGFYPDSIRLLRQERTRFPVPLHVIDGNHEDHSWLRRAMLSGGPRAWKEELNLIYQPRASVAQLWSTLVGFLGGALHVDRPQQHHIFSRFPNYILRHNCEQAVALFNREKPDLIVTHSCPAGIGIGIHGSPDLAWGVDEFISKAGFDPGPPDDRGDMELGRLWQELRVKPRAWVFGHFHSVHAATVQGTRFYCVDELKAPIQKLVIWDTEEKKLLLCPADPSL